MAVVLPGSSVLLEGGEVVREARVEPGAMLQLPLLGLVQRLELTQETGVGTVEASVSVRFDRRPVVAHCVDYSPPELTVT